MTVQTRLFHHHDGSLEVMEVLDEGDRPVFRCRVCGDTVTVEMDVSQPSDEDGVPGTTTGMLADER